MSGSGLMNILVCGLGLIGASLAKTLKKNTNHHIMGWNRTDSVAKRALADGVIDETGELEAMMPKADVTIVNFYPEAIAPFIKEHKDLFKKNSIVTDSCGIKTKICRELEKENFDFYFVGAHPMAGREVSGYDNSLDDLFDNASFICTPCDSIPNPKDLCRSYITSGFSLKNFKNLASSSFKEQNSSNSSPFSPSNAPIATYCVKRDFILYLSPY